MPDCGYPIDELRHAGLLSLQGAGTTTQDEDQTDGGELMDAA
jgi:hypothetical protein